MLQRRLFALWICAALTACGGSPPPPATPTTATPTATPAAVPAPAPAPAEEAVLNVFNWSDYIAEDTIERFTKETGIKVQYDVYDSNEILEAKLMAGSSGYDVVFPTARPFAQRHIKANLYRELDKSKLPNWPNLDPVTLQGLEDVDPGNKHLMPYMLGSTGIGYNVAAVKKRLGDKFPLDSWNLLFDPAVTAKLKDCGVAFLDDEQEGFYASLIYLGRDPFVTNDEQLEAVKKLFAGVRPYVRYFNSSKYIDDLANGEICISSGYSGDVAQARDRAGKAGNGIEIAYLIPKEGAVRAVDSAAIPSDAPHPDNAHKFINFLLRPDVIAPITNRVSYANANLKATPLVDEAILKDPGVYPPPEVVAKLVAPRTPPEADSRLRVRAWTTIKSGQ